MTQITKHLWFRSVAAILVISSITFDIAWADPSSISESATLNVPSLFQQSIRAEIAAKSLAISSIGKFLLGDAETGEKPFDLKYLQSTMSSEIRRGLDGIDLSKVVLTDGGVILMPFENERGKFLFQIALRDNPAIKGMAGYEEKVSDTYIVKVAARLRADNDRAGDAKQKPGASSMAVEDKKESGAGGKDTGIAADHEAAKSASSGIEGADNGRIADWETSREGIVQEFGRTHRLPAAQAKEEDALVAGLMELEWSSLRQGLYSGSRTYDISFRLRSGTASELENGRIIFDIFVRPVEARASDQQRFYKGFVALHFRNGIFDELEYININDTRRSAHPWLAPYIVGELNALKGASFSRPDSVGASRTRGLKPRGDFATAAMPSKDGSDLSAAQDSGSAVTQFVPYAYTVATRSAGDIQVGSPPELIKHFMRNKRPVPSIVVLPKQTLIDGINYGDVEFICYFNYFVNKGRKVTIVGTADQVQRIREILQETLFGPSVREMVSAGMTDGEAAGLKKEFDYFRKKPDGTPASIDDFVTFVTYDNQSATVGDVTIGVSERGFSIGEGGRTIAEIPHAEDGLAAPEAITFPDKPFRAPGFGFTCVGSSTGFDPAGLTTSFITWWNGRGMLVDPLVYSVSHMRSLGINPEDVRDVFLSHVHGDHDAGLMEMILNGHRVNLITSRVIFESFLRKAKAITGQDLRGMVTFVEARPGEKLQYRGGSFDFSYGLHSIPCLRFRMSFRGRSLSYSGDTRFEPEFFKQLKAEGVIDGARAEDLLNHIFGADIVIHEAGGLPLHTQVPVLSSLPEELKRKIYVVHSPKVDPATGLRKPVKGENIDLLADDMFAVPENEDILAMRTVGFFDDLDLREILILTRKATPVNLAKGDIIMREGESADRFYVISAGEVEIAVKDAQGNMRKIMLGRGSSFGEQALLAPGRTRNATITALTDVRLLAFDRARFGELLEGEGVKARMDNVDANRQFLSKVPAFLKLPPRGMIELCSMAQPRSFRKDEYVIKQGEPGDSFCIIKSGEVDIIDEAIGKKIAAKKAGDVMGEIALLRDTPRTASVRAASDTLEVLVIRRKDFDGIIQKYPYVRYYLEQLSAQRLQHTEDERRAARQKESGPVSAEEVGAAMDWINSMAGKQVFSAFRKARITAKIMSMGLEKGKRFLVVGPGVEDYLPVLLAKLGIETTTIETNPEYAPYVELLAGRFMLGGMIRNVSNYGEISGKEFDYISLFAVLNRVSPEFESAIRGIVGHMNDGGKIYANFPIATAVTQTQSNTLTALDASLEKIGAEQGKRFIRLGGVDVSDLSLMPVNMDEGRGGVAYAMTSAAPYREKPGASSMAVEDKKESGAGGKDTGIAADHEAAKPASSGIEAKAVPGAAQEASSPAVVVPAGQGAAERPAEQRDVEQAAAPATLQQEKSPGSVSPTAAEEKAPEGPFGPEKRIFSEAEIYDEMVHGIPATGQVVPHPLDNPAAAYEWEVHGTGPQGETSLDEINNKWNAEERLRAGASAAEASGGPVEGGRPLEQQNKVEQVAVPPALPSEKLKRSDAPAVQQAAPGSHPGDISYSSINIRELYGKVLAQAVIRQNIEKDDVAMKLCNEFTAAAVDAALDLKKFVGGKRAILTQEKADKSLVTEADRVLNQMLKERLEKLGIPVIGEESEHASDVIQSGTYIAVDPIDGTSNFVSVFNGETEKPALDHVTLIGFVEKGIPVVGVCFNHYTGELDVAVNRGDVKLQSRINLSDGTGLSFVGLAGAQRVEELRSDKALVLGSKAKDPINEQYGKVNPIAKIGGLGFRIISLCNKKLTSGLVYHKSQESGLWDLAAPYVFASLNGVTIYDGRGARLDFTKAAYFPGNGAIAVKGDALGFADPGDDIGAIQKGYQELKALIVDKIGPMLKKYRDHPDSLDAELKKDNTWATRADLDVQEALVRFIRSNFPGHRIIAEEMFSDKSGEELRAFMEDVKRAEYAWVIDPIDGTQPFKEGGNRYCVGISLLRNGNPILSVVYAPEYDIDGKGHSLFEANAWSPGAYLNGNRLDISGSRPRSDRKALIYKSPHLPTEEYQDIIARYFDASVSSDFFSSLLSICRVACTDSHDFEVLYTRPHPKIWDVIQAGYILVKAGGRFVDSDGRGAFPVDMNGLRPSGSGEPRMSNIIVATEGAYRRYAEALKKNVADAAPSSDIAGTAVVAPAGQGAAERPAEQRDVEQAAAPATLQQEKSPGSVSPTAAEEKAPEGPFGPEKRIFSEAEIYDEMVHGIPATGQVVPHPLDNPAAAYEWEVHGTGPQGETSLDEISGKTATVSAAQPAEIAARLQEGKEKLDMVTRRAVDDFLRYAGTLTRDISWGSGLLAHYRQSLRNNQAAFGYALAILMMDPDPTVSAGAKWAAQIVFRGYDGNMEWEDYLNSTFSGLDVLKDHKEPFLSLVRAIRIEDDKKWVFEKSRGQEDSAKLDKILARAREDLAGIAAPRDRLERLRRLIFDAGGMDNLLQIIGFCSRASDLAQEIEKWPGYLSGKEYELLRLALPAADAKPGRSGMGAKGAVNSTRMALPSTFKSGAQASSSGDFVAVVESDARHLTVFDLKTGSTVAGLESLPFEFFVISERYLAVTAKTSAGGSRGLYVYDLRTGKPASGDTEPYFLLGDNVGMFDYSVAIRGENVMLDYRYAKGALLPHWALVYDIPTKKLLKKFSEQSMPNRIRYDLIGDAFITEIIPDEEPRAGVLSGRLVAYNVRKNADEVIYDKAVRVSSVSEWNRELYLAAGVLPSAMPELRWAWVEHLKDGVSEAVIMKQATDAGESAGLAAKPAAARTRPGKSPEDLEKLIRRYTQPGQKLSAPVLLDIYAARWKEMGFERPAKIRKHALKTIQRDLFSGPRSLLRQNKVVERTFRGLNGERVFAYTGFTPFERGAKKRADEMATGLAARLLLGNLPPQFDALTRRSEVRKARKSFGIKIATALIVALTPSMLFAEKATEAALASARASETFASLPALVCLGVVVSVFLAFILFEFLRTRIENREVLTRARLDKSIRAQGAGTVEARIGIILKELPESMRRIRPALTLARSLADEPNGAWEDVYAARKSMGLSIEDLEIVRLALFGPDETDVAAAQSPAESRRPGKPGQSSMAVDDARAEGWDLKKASEEVALIRKNLAFLWDPDIEAVYRAATEIMKGETPLTPQSYADLVEAYKAYLAGNDLQKANSAQYGLESNERLVYFCMEYGLTDRLNTYGGGLGILAGDHLKGASDRYAKDTFVGVGLAWNKGYFQQAIEPSGRSAGEQVERYPVVPLEQYAERVRVKDSEDRDADLVIKIEVPDNKYIYAKAWRVRTGRAELYLLDTDIPENDGPEALAFSRAITWNLYAADEREWRFKQEYLLGIGGMRLLQELGIKPAALHINEGHAAFAALELIQRELAERAKALNMTTASGVDMRKSDPERARSLGISFEQALSTVKSKIGFTSHTPIPAGNEEFDPALFQHYFRHYCLLHGLDIETLMKIAVSPSKARGGVNMANLSKLAIALSADVPAEEAAKPIAERSVVTRNGVSRKGGEVSKALYDDESFGAITNSVHRRFWQSPVMRELLETRWLELQARGAAPKKAIELLSREERVTHLKTLMDSITNEELLQAQRRMKAEAVRHLAATRGVTLDKDAFTIVVSRRFASYKRLGMILGIDDAKSVMEEDFEGQILDKLIRAAQEKDLKLQIVFAGKAHSQDQAGKDIIAKINKAAATEKWRDVIVFVPDYDIDVAKDLIQIATVWENNPIPPHEASGTSGEKAAANGVMSVSTPDGWVIEADPRSTVFLFGKEGYYNDIMKLKDDARLRRQLDEQDVRELEDMYMGDWRDRGSDREKGIIDMYRYHPERWAERVRGTVYDFMVNFDMPRFIEDYEQKMYLPLVRGGRDAAQKSGWKPASSGIEQAGPASRAAVTTMAPAETRHVTELFEIVENTINNERARVVKLTNQLEAHLSQGVVTESVRVEDAAAKIKAAAEEVAGLAETTAAPWDDTAAREMAAELRTSLKQFEADSIVGALIVLARRAKFDNQKLIIGLETDWIPGYNEQGSYQQNAISSLVREIASLDQTLRSMGLDNVVILHKTKDELARAVSDEAVRTNTKLSNVILFGSNATLASGAFNALRSTAGDARAFMAAVDPSELNAFYDEHKDSTEEQLTIRIMDMLCMALELAVGKEPPQLPIIASYDKALRTVIFLPKVEPADYEKIRRLYNAARTALQAA